ncbi:Na+/H+ antiporter NhaD/arsenite permease-like protein [Anaerosolibacter carboniphilus]|uniref:Na+/H+ antiporter NhaD/arsenite permease-like protein n=1 Tax=Anaerosolibacter carboniphilus TaxID=1417629 RepID=A0A841KXK5_9FIRM|nr:SLC13 family permease [Anaerosolibacter carboniphilus]MBB6215662.1 Na+/H+ antiporter NhaD/arsenite permease-like protein [Anaerosolibacter carboniphilus]
MNMGLISLLVLVVAIFVGFKRNVNTGLVSIAFAFLLGFFVMTNISKDPAVAKMVAMSSAEAKGTALIAGWNTSLFFILVGMTFLFAIAKVNGTLELLARKAAYMAGGNRKLIPILFFIFSTILAAIGPGNIAVCALVLPIAMAVAREEKINSLLMAGMVIAGSNAGGLSPIAPTGIIGVQLAEKIGFQTGQHVFMNMIIAQVIIAAVMYVVLGGFKLKADVGVTKEKPAAFNGVQIQTLVVIALVVAAIIVLNLNIGMIAFLGGATLLLLGAADEKKTIASMPWSTLLLVCGVGVLVNVVDKAGGITYLTDTLSAFMGTKTAAPILTIVGGLMSAVSSASGVVMPTLIPTVPGLVETMGGAVKGETLISAIILGAHFVTNSPLSTLGALAMASADESETDKLFGQLLILGFGGILFGALLVFIGIVR